MVSDRLSHLQSEVKGYYEQLAGKETAKRLAEEAEKVRIQQQIGIAYGNKGEYDRAIADYNQAILIHPK